MRLQPRPVVKSGFAAAFLACLASSGTARAGAVALPVSLPLAQVGGLTEINAVQAAQQDLQGNNARAVMNQAPANPAGGQPPAAADATTANDSGDITRIAMGTILVLLCSALAVYSVGRPVRRLAPDGS